MILIDSCKMTLKGINHDHICGSVSAVPPIIRESSSEVTTHVGQDALLPCEVEEESHATVTWRKDGFPITQDNR